MNPQSSTRFDRFMEGLRFKLGDQVALVEAEKTRDPKRTHAIVHVDGDLCWIEGDPRKFDRLTGREWPKMRSYCAIHSIEYLTEVEGSA